jgi:peptidoglycan/xylan/chitin deacetylase (PgdA/CDA1 family)
MVVNPYDYVRPDKDELKRRILQAVRPGAVVLLHCGVLETIEVLPEVIRVLRERGVEFGCLPNAPGSAQSNRGSGANRELRSQTP